jgi:MoaA/NifB/PqqE/SkfB family radical SAM enzyme
LNQPTAGIPSVDWWITSQCNLACDFCYGPEPEKDSVRRQAEILKRDEIFKALEDSSARVVTFCGGEPLLVDKISKYAATLKQHGKFAVLNTNGQLLQKRLRDQHPDRAFRMADFAMIGISVDGSTPDIHNTMRGGRGGKPNLDKVLQAARLVVREPGVELKIATVMSKVNRQDLPALAEIVRRLNPAIWRLYQYSGRGSWNIGQQRHRLEDDEFQLLAEEAEHLAKPVPTVRSTEAQSEGCLIVDSVGNVLQPTHAGYVQHGSCLDQPLDRIWADIPTQSTIIDNKRWLAVLPRRNDSRQG